MNKTTALVIVVVVLVAFGVVFTVVPAVLPKTDSASILVECYDQDDKIVYSDTSQDVLRFPWAFTDPTGKSVSKIKVTVSYTTSSTGEVNSLSVAGKIDTTVRLNTITASIVNTDQKSLTAQSAQSGTFPVTEYLLTDLITPVDTSGKTYGWAVEFKVTITASATVDGEQVTATPWSSTISIQVKWDIEGLTVTGTIDKTSS